MAQDPVPPPLHPRFDFAGLLLPKPKTLLILLGILALAGVAWMVLRAQQEKKAAHLATVALQAGKYNEAHLWARRALAFNSRNLPALDVMCRIGTLPGLDPVPWLQKALAVEPASFPRFRSLVLELMRQKRYAEIDSLIAGAPGVFESEADYQSLLGTFALGRGRFQPAVQAFRKAAELDPASASHRLNLWSALLNSPDSQEARKAAQDLLRWEAPPELRPQALTNLLSSQLGKKSPSAMETLDALFACPQASFELKLGSLSRCVREGPDPGIAWSAARLELLKQEARSSARFSYQLVITLHRLGRREEARSFLVSLPDNLRRKPELVVARAEARILAGNWEALALLCDKEDWGKYGSIKRLVEIFLQARASSAPPDRSKNPSFKILMQELNGDPGELAGLVDIAHFWKWTSLEVSLLEEASRNPLLQKDARIKLYHHYQSAGNTIGLYELMKAQAGDNPQDLVAQNNLTCLGLLLGVNPGAQHDRAVDFHRLHPQDPSGASTLALSHMLRGEFAPALELLAALPAETLNESGAALYYAWALSGVGQPEKAQQILLRVDRANLLPEECKIYDELAAQKTTRTDP